MSDINFLPSKDKETQRDDEHKKPPRPRGPVEFHHPASEHTPPPEQPSSGVLKKLGSLFQKKKPSPAPTPSIPETQKPVNKKTDSKVSPLKTPATPAQAPRPVNKAVPGTPPGTGPLTERFSSVDVNLLPWQDPNAQTKKVLRVVLVIVSAAGIIGWGMVLRLSNNELKLQKQNLESEIASLDAQLKNVDVEFLAEGSAAAIKQERFISLYRKLPVWSKFLQWLEANTNKDIYFTNLVVTNPNRINIDGVAPSYESAAKQWLAFRSDPEWIEEVVAQEFTLVEDQDDEGDVTGEHVKFSVVIDLQDAIILRDPSAYDPEELP